MDGTHIGILLAIGALIGWAVGDFFIQKTTRIIGVWVTRLFLNGMVVIALTPLVLPDLQRLIFRPDWMALLTGAALAMLLGGYYSLRALKEGKLAVVEPLTGLELPLTVGIAVVAGHEMPTPTQFMLIGLIFIGVTLAITKGRSDAGRHDHALEKGAAYAIIGAFGLAVTNFTIGLASRSVSPLLTLWFTGLVVTFCCLAIMAARGDFQRLPSHVATHGKLIWTAVIIDNLAWVCFVFAVTFIPISITTSISESYIAVAAFLGITLNKERFRPHQFVGLAFAIGGVILLAAVT